MNSNLNTLMTVCTVGLYIINKIMVDVLHIMNSVFVKIVSDGWIGLAVLISAASTAVLNGYRFYQMYQERKKNNKQQNLKS